MTVTSFSDSNGEEIFTVDPILYELEKYEDTKIIYTHENITYTEFH